MSKLVNSFYNFSLKKIAMVVVNALIVLLMGVWTLISGASGFFGTYHWVLPLLAFSWGIFSVVLGGGVVISVVVFFTSGVEMLTLKVVTSKKVRELFKFLTGRGIFINIVLIFISLVASAFVLSFKIVIVQLIALILTAGLYFTVDLLRKRIRTVVNMNLEESYD